MSRKSTASLSVVQVTQLRRLDPPDDLTDGELALWRRVVDSKPADWFQEDSAPLLTEYVRAVDICDLLSRQIQETLAAGPTDENVPAALFLKPLLDMRDKESKRVASLATKLRLTQQSRYTPMAAATANKKAGGERPWLRG